MIDRFVPLPPDSFVAGHGGKKTSAGRLESRGADDGDEEEKEVSGHDTGREMGRIDRDEAVLDA